VTNWLSCWLAPLADANKTKRALLNGLTFGVCLALAGIVTFPDRRKSPISLCEITANPERYAGKVVRVRAVISRDVVVGAPEDFGIPEASAFAACTARNDRATAFVSLNQASRLGLTPNRRIWRDRTDVASFNLSEGIIVGRFEPHEDGITRCLTPRYEFANAVLESLISTTTVSPERALAWVESKSQ